MEVHRIHFETVSSTNQWAKEHLHKLDQDALTCISASVQTAGYGRRKHAWVSACGNLHLSLFFTVQADDPIIQNISQLVGLSLAKCLAAMGIQTKIKWPNDLLFERKKLAGILVETLPLDDRLGIVIGIGMNVNVPVQTDQPTISLHEIAGKPFEMESLIEAICNAFLAQCSKGFQLSEYAAFLAYIGEPIVCSIGNKQVEGILMGLSESGNLNLKLHDGTLTQVTSGEIHTLRQK